MADVHLSPEGHRRGGEPAGRIRSVTRQLAAVLTVLAGLLVAVIGGAEPAGALTTTVDGAVLDAATSSPWAGTETVGASAYDTASVVNQGMTPTGSLTYSLFQGAGCSGSAQGADTVTLNPDGSVPPSDPEGPLGAGTYSFEANYLGDANYPAGNDCQPFTVSPGMPTSPTVTNIPPSPVELGSFVATVGTDGDGTTSVTSSTPGVCSVGPDGLTVTFVGFGTCSLTARVASGSNYVGAAGDPQSFAVDPAPRGYWLVGSDGGIFSFGAAGFFGSMGGTPLQRPVVGITPTSTREGYWLDASDGGIFAFGDAGFYGSIPGQGLHPAGSGLPGSLDAPIVGMVPSSTGQGYFMVASDGGVFAFGDAKFEGSCPAIAGGCSGAAVAVMPDHSGDGYWLVTSTGAVYSFGDAQFFGAPAPQLVAVVDAVATPDGNGYWILYANGAVAAFGDAVALGGPVGYVNAYNPARAIFPVTDGRGYWVAAARGDVFSYGDAPFLGGMAAKPLNGSIIAADGF